MKYCTSSIWQWIWLSIHRPSRRIEVFDKYYTRFTELLDVLPSSKLITRTMNLEGTRPRADTECPTARYAGQPSNLSWSCSYVHYSRIREVGGYSSQLSSLDVYRRLSPHGCAFRILALLVICPRKLWVYADCCVGGKNHIAFESMFSLTIYMPTSSSLRERLFDLDKRYRKLTTVSRFHPGSTKKTCRCGVDRFGTNARHNRRMTATGTLVGRTWALDVRPHYIPSWLVIGCVLVGKKPYLLCSSGGR